jgi:Transposase, Mutator family
MGLSGISKSQVSKLCKDIDERVNAFLDRPIAGEWPYLWLDATYLKVRDGGIVTVTTVGLKRPGPVGIHAAATEPCHCAAASALKIRSVDREMRWR